MGLQLSTNRQASAHVYDNSAGQGCADVELAQVDVNPYDTLEGGDRDEHAYGVASVAASGDRGEHTYGVASVAKTPSARKDLRSSEVTFSRRSVIILVVSGVILSAVISILSGVVVNHVTNGKMTQTDPEVKTSHQLGTLEQIQINVSRLQEIFEQTQANTTRGLKQLEVNTREELNALGTTQTETSRYIETLTAGQNATNLQLEILQEKLNSSGLQVAFSVYSLNPDLLADRTPTFYRTATNTGHYNMTSGKFTCPVAGLYYFSLTIEHGSTSSGSVYCNFRVNGSGSVYVTARRSPYQSASGSVIQQLSFNDVVSLYCTGWQYVQTRYSNAVFSGFLVSPD